VDAMAAEIFILRLKQMIHHRFPYVPATGC
jgi:hypothetical protein